MSGATAIERLFPSGVCVATRHISTVADDHPIPESAAVARAVPKRRREFIAGRMCAHAALAALGQPADAIPVGESRAPRWPEGVTGSISHAGDLCAAVVGRCERFVGLGLDVEVDTPLGEELWTSVCTPAELRAIERHTGLPGALAKVLFSAKEAVYKCQHPRTGRFLDFLDVHVDIDVAAGAYVATLPEDAGAYLPDGPRLEGRFARADGMILCGVALLRR